MLLPTTSAKLKVVLPVSVLVTKMRVAAYQVRRPTPPCARALHEVARVFMEQDGQNALGHIVSDGLVGVGSGITVREAFDALPEARMLIGELRDPASPRPAGITGNR